MANKTILPDILRIQLIRTTRPIPSRLLIGHDTTQEMTSSHALARHLAGDIQVPELRQQPRGLAPRRPTQGAVVPLYEDDPRRSRDGNSLLDRILDGVIEGRRRDGL